MADLTLIQNANRNAQTAIETADKAVATAEKAMQCYKELAPVQGAQEAEIARLTLMTNALSHFLFDAELSLISLLLEMGKPLSEHQQQVLEMQAKMEGETVQETTEPDPNAPRQLALHIVADDDPDTATESPMSAEEVRGLQEAGCQVIRHSEGSEEIVLP